MSDDIRDEFDIGPIYAPGNPHQRRNQLARKLQRMREDLRTRNAAKRAAFIDANPTVGSWTLLGVGVPKGVHTTVRCRCKCGAIHDVYLSGLKSGKSTKCKQCYHDSKKGKKVGAKRK